MEIVRDPIAVHIPRPTVMTVGSFDGIHRGHEHLIASVVARAKETDSASALVTLHPHPKIVLRPSTELQYLSTIDERLDLLAPLGLDYAVVFPFSLETSQIRARDFVAILMDHLNMRELFCGADFAFGYKREGNVEFLRALGAERGFHLTVVEPQRIDGQIMSSTRVRQLIADGDLDEARRQLGRFPAVRGRVVRGDQRGRQLGFPTANLAVGERRLIPANGVYACRVRLPDHGPNGKWLGGAASIGVRPTFGVGLRLLEVYILDFDDDLYDQVIEVQFIKRLRPEEKFDSAQALIEQMQQDVANTRRVLEETFR